MTIAERVVECIEKSAANQTENALIQVCIALDATAKNEHPTTKKVGKRFKAFIQSNHDVITFFSLNGNIVKNTFRVGDLTFTEMVYKVLRCGLLHEGELPKLLKFAPPGQTVSFSDQLWHLPTTFVTGTLLAVIGAATNANHRIGPNYKVTFAGKDFPINDLWGRIDKVRDAIYAGRDV